MLLRLFLIAMLIGFGLRLIGRVLRTLLTFPSMKTTSHPKKPSHNIDDSQIQDADFKDL